MFYKYLVKVVGGTSCDRKILQKSRNRSGDQNKSAKYASSRKPILVVRQSTVHHALHNNILPKRRATTSVIILYDLLPVIQRFPLYVVPSPNGSDLSMKLLLDGIDSIRGKSFINIFGETAAAAQYG